MTGTNPADARERNECLYRVLVSRIFEPLALYYVESDDSGTPADVRYLDVNPAYERIMGVRREDMIGKTFFEAWSAKESEWRDIIIRVATGGESAWYEGWSVDTNRYLHSLAFSPEKGEVAVIFMDKTDWKHAIDALAENETRLIEYRSELRRLAAELSLSEEKTRREIAATLHDHFGYSLAAILHRLQGLDRPDVDGGVRAELSAIAAMLEETIGETRSFTFRISSPSLYLVGLEAAIDSLGEGIFAPVGIRWDFVAAGVAPPLALEVRVLLYQMTRELLFNVLKHAKASTVTVRVRHSDESVCVVVEDDGVGFVRPPEKHWGKWKGLGLFSIRERLHAFGGTIRILSSRGKGTTVILVAPRRADAPPETAAKGARKQ